MKHSLLLNSALLFAAISTGQAGLVTNNVPFGEALTFSASELYNSNTVSQFKSDELLYYRLRNNYFKSPDDTNMIPVHFLVLPYSQSFNFQLFDDKGDKVRKTLKGWLNSKEAKIPEHCEELKSGGVLGSDTRPLFVPSDMFAIKDAGTYELEIRMKICVPLTNGMPDIKAMTAWRDIHVSPSNPHYPNTNWGILTSAPVRVNIIKE